MSIVYYPDEQYKKSKHVVEQTMAKSQILSFTGGGDLTSNALSVVHSYPGDWIIKCIEIYFSSSSNKTYSVSKLTGRQIVTGANDRLYFNGTVSEKIVLPSGFYTGATLAAALKTAMDSTTAFSAAGMTPFTVAYTNGVFTITPNAGNIGFDVYNSGVVGGKNSTGGHVFGFTADKTPAAAISGVAVPGLGTLTSILAASSVATQNVIATDSIFMDVDDAIQVDFSSVSMTGQYKILYSPA